jgi:hypothetical protein
MSEKTRLASRDPGRLTHRRAVFVVTSEGSALARELGEPSGFRLGQRSDVTSATGTARFETRARLIPHRPSLSASAHIIAAVRVTVRGAATSCGNDYAALRTTAQVRD